MTFAIPTFKAAILSMMIFFIFTSLPAAAADLKAGTVIGSANLEAMLLQTFEGKTIKSMLSDKIRWMIEKHGLTITLRPYEKVPVDPRWLAATKKYAGAVTFDPGTRRIAGYKAGLAFPDISEADPHAAVKLIWNLYLNGGWPRSDFMYVPRLVYLMIDGNKGIERSMKWTYMRSWMTGRISGDPVAGDATMYYKQLLCGYYPYDIQGAGSFLVRYTDGRMDDIWTYVRTSRRSRRLLGGSWMDPIGSTDQLNDEINIFSAYPTWYPAYRILGKQTILAIAHSRGIAWDENNPDNPFPSLNDKTPPYWNPINEWEPREVWVVEADMPKEHPFKRRVYYFDTQTWIPYLAECYDKKDQFVKILIFAVRPIKGDDGEGSWGNLSVSGHLIDFAKNHATVFFNSEETRRNPSGMQPRHVTLSVMEAIAQGQWKQPF